MIGTHAKETHMYRTLCKTTVFALMLALTLASRGMAQQQQHQEHHPGGTPTSQEQPAATGGEKDDEGDAQAPRMQQMQGMMGHGGMMSGMMQRHLARLTQQLGLNDDQRAQAQYIMRNHAKEIIRLRANIATLHIDLRQLLDTDPVDLPKVKKLLQTIAAQEADVRLS